VTPELETVAEGEITDAVRRFWDSEPCGSELSGASPEDRSYFEELTRRRYEIEPHVPELVRFERWRGQDVLEVGCGPGTDGERFARAGARYTGVDLSGESLLLARKRFELFDLPGELRQVDATGLPFEDETFDFVYSHGVIHHIPAVEEVVREIHRVLRPGGEALVMVYNRSSLNYRLSISILRRLGALLLALPGGPQLAHRLTGEPPAVLDEHRRLLRKHGVAYVTDLELFLSRNTDGPGNPYSRVYGAGEARRLFSGFGRVEMEVRYLNLRSYPPAVRRLFPKDLERRAGWHRYIRAVK
jgi:SAM-dependent methyltransferase